MKTRNSQLALYMRDAREESVKSGKRQAQNGFYFFFLAAVIKKTKMRLPRKLCYLEDTGRLFHLLMNI